MDCIEKLWKEFKDEIKYDNRYFNDSRIIELLYRINDIKMFPEGTKIKFYRARKGNYVTSLEHEMLQPPREIAKAGRCNPEGIPYLYLAMEEETAIAELKVEKEEVTIAEFEVDVSNVFSFLYYKYSYMEPYMDKDTKILISLINDDMKKTVNSLRDYIPLQYISEFVKHMRYDGFMYSSVVSEGINLVLFNSNKAIMLDRYLR